MVVEQNIWPGKCILKVIFQAILHNSYWCSTGQHKADDIVIWGAKFRKLTRVHGLNIIWAYAPGQYSIEYSADGKNFITLLKFRNSVNKGNRGWWKKLEPLLKLKFRSFPDRINFDSPVFAKKIRILMKNPVNHFFGIYRVEFFVRDWAIVIKNSQKNQCKENCWTVNSLRPKVGTPIECNLFVILDADCIDQIGIGENRELFILSPNGMIRHFNTGLCVVTNTSKSLILDNCYKAVKERKDGSAFFIFKSNGSIQTEFDLNYCLSIPEKYNPYNYAMTATPIASSTIIDDNHEAKNAIGNNFI